MIVVQHEFSNSLFQKKAETFLIKMVNELYAHINTKY